MFVQNQTIVSQGIDIWGRNLIGTVKTNVIPSLKIDVSIKKIYVYTIKYFVYNQNTHEYSHVLKSHRCKSIIGKKKKQGVICSLLIFGEQ